MIDDFVAHMVDYANDNGLGRPTLLIDQGEKHFGIALDWRDDRRAFAFSRASWKIADFQRLCDKFRGAF